MSQTQVLPNDITHLCQEIRDIKRGSTHDDNIGQINKLKRLSKHLSNTPDLDQGRRDKDGPGYAETEYNKLRSFPPNDNPNNPLRYEPLQSPDRPESSSNIVEDPEESPVAGTASDSPSSPAETKLSSR